MSKQLDQQWWKEYNELPRKIMERELYEVHKGDWKAFLDNVMWDTPPPPKTEEEKLEEEKERLWNAHPFKDFIDKDSILL